MRTPQRQHGAAPDRWRLPAMATVVTNSTSPGGSPTQCVSPGGGRGPALEGISSLRSQYRCGRSAVGRVWNTQGLTRFSFSSAMFQLP